MWILRFTRTLELNRFVLPSDMKRTEQYQSGRKAFTGLFRLQPTLSSGTIAATTEQGDFVSAAETVPEEFSDGRGGAFFSWITYIFFYTKNGGFLDFLSKIIAFLDVGKSVATIENRRQLQSLHYRYVPTAFECS